LQLPSASIWQIATISLWVKFPNWISWSKELKFYSDWDGSHRNMIAGCWASIIYFSTWNNWTSQNDFSVSSSLWTWWNNIILIKNWTSQEIFVNWVSIWTHTSTYNSSLPWWSNTTYIWHPSTDSDSKSAYWYVKDYIIENKARTSDEIAKYYKQTKWNYWL
jgi:hypothetical protein